MKKILRVTAFGVGGAGSSVVFFAALILFLYAVIWCYFVFFEALSRGQTPGKRIAGIRVVLDNGLPVGWRESALRNLVRDPRISLLFMIPGIDSTLRINGRAEIVVDAELSASFAMNGKLPRCVLVVTADRVYTQCPKALVRSRLWSPDVQIARSELPSPGEMIAALSKGAIDGAEYDRAYPQRLKETIY
jgi:hypothetical protein